MGDLGAQADLNKARSERVCIENCIHTRGLLIRTGMDDKQGTNYKNYYLLRFLSELRKAERWLPRVNHRRLEQVERGLQI